MDKNFGPQLIWLSLLPSPWYLEHHIPSETCSKICAGTFFLRNVHFFPHNFFVFSIYTSNARGKLEAHRSLLEPTHQKHQRFCIHYFHKCLLDSHHRSMQQILSGFQQLKKILSKVKRQEVSSQRDALSAITVTKVWP